jgi:four helix bundle protein
MAQSFRDLKVWQRAMQLTLAIYHLTRDFPSEEQYGLTAQIRRAAISIPSNIAEGQGRLGAPEFRQFLAVARGSNCELQTQLELARALNFGKPKLIDEAEVLSNEIRKMLFSLLDSLKKPANQQL